MKLAKDYNVRPMGSTSAVPAVPHRKGEGTVRMGSLPEESHLVDRRANSTAAVRRIALPNKLSGYRLGSREQSPPLSKGWASCGRRPFGRLVFPLSRRGRESIEVPPPAVEPETAPLS